MRLVATLYITRREQDPRNSPAIEQKLLPFEINVENIFCLKKPLQKSPRGSWFARSPPIPPPPLVTVPTHTCRSPVCLVSVVNTLIIRRPSTRQRLAVTHEILICLSRRTFLLNRIPGTPGTAVPSRKTRPGRTTR